MPDARPRAEVPVEHAALLVYGRRMQTAQFGGPLSALRDPATGNQTSGRLFGTISYEAQGDVSQVMPMVQQAVLNAAVQVITEKLQTNQVALPTLAQSLPYFAQEIIGRSGAQQYGVQITQLVMQVQLENAGMPQQPPPPQQMPPTPMQAMQSSLEQQAQDRLDPRNYNVKARINVGGFRIKASTDGGVDTAGLMSQAKDKAKSTVIWWAGGCLVLLVVGIGLLALALYVYRQAGTASTPAAGTATAVAWDGKAPFTCGGNEHVKLSGVTANLTSGTAVSASGNCDLELADCDITAPTAIAASGNAKVTVTGGSVSGSDDAATAAANAHVTFSGTKVTGKKKQSGLGKVVGP